MGSFDLVIDQAHLFVFFKSFIFFFTSASFPTVVDTTGLGSIFSEPIIRTFVVNQLKMLNL